MARYRSISEAHKILKAEDPETAISEYFVRQLVLDGKIPSIRSGNKSLLDVDVLMKFLYGTSESRSTC